jgi:hypothetical protein
MENKRTPLMALALAGIAAPAAHATTTVESTDYSNSQSSPTNLGAFNPASDAIVGTLINADTVDTILVSGTPNAAVSLPISFTSFPFPSISFLVYDDAGPTGLLASNNYSSSPGSDTFNFVVPADGDYMMVVAAEVGNTSYTIGTVVPVPEPGTAALLTAGLAVAALVRRGTRSSQTR